MPSKSCISILPLKHLHQIDSQFIQTQKPHILNPILGKILTTAPSPHHVFFFYNEMLRHPSSHNHYTFTYALKACSSLRQLRKGLEIHARVLKSGHFFDNYIMNSLLHFYLAANEVSSAYWIFSSIPSPDVVSWTSIISGLSKLGLEAEAIAMFSSMNVHPNSSTLVSVISACTSLRALKLGKAIHGYSFRHSNERNVILDNAVINLYVRCGCLRSAEQLFEKMPERDVFSWTTMVGGYAHSGFCEKAVGIFQEMTEQEEIKPNEATLVSVLSACSSMGALSLGQFVHSYIDSRRIRIDGNVGNALMNMYVKCGTIRQALSVFNMLSHKDVISWSTIIFGMAMNGHGDRAVQLFPLMLLHGVPPDDVTFLGLLFACSHAGLVEKGLMFFKAMNEFYGVSPQMQHYASVVDMYGRSGRLAEAEKFIRGMPVEADGPVWGALLNACKIHRDEQMFERARQGLVETNGVSIGTFALMSNTYASCERWDDANEIRDDMRSKGLKKIAGCSWIEAHHNSAHVEISF